MSENTVTQVGNLVRDPELRMFDSGSTICKMSIAVNRRKKKGDEWEDETSFFNCVAWGELGENAAESLRKGMRVIVTGTLEQRSWEKDGQKHSAVEIKVEEIGPALRFATADVRRTEKKGAGPSQSGSDRKAPRNEAPAYDDEEPF